MEHSIIGGLTIILTLGLAAQWLGWRFKQPSILMLLLFGFLAGPVFHFVSPDEMFGDLLFPFVSGAVAVILFEGGLTLKFRDFQQAGGIITRLVFIGALVTFILATLASYYLLDLGWGLSAVFGGLLTVTGPTVIGPMLRTIRPRGKVKNVAKWEGILNDPVGAVFAVLLFEAYLLGGSSSTPMHVIQGILTTLGVGLLLGGLVAWFLIWAVRTRMLPEFLHNPFTLLAVLGSFALSDMIQKEAGLLTVTVIGIVLANQPYFPIRHISEFKENLQVLFISTLFIILSARVSPDTFSHLGIGSIIFLTLLILVIRPAAVVAATVGTQTTWRDRVLLMLLAPRGIVAAAVASLFALRLADEGMAGGERMMAEMLLVIVGTVLVYGTLAGPIAQKMKLTNLNPQGVLFVGAHSWAREMAKKLSELGIYVALVDFNQHHVYQARHQGLVAYQGNVFSEEFLETIDFSAIGHVVAITGNDEVNAFAETHLTDFIERSDIYHLTPTVSESNPYGDQAKRMNPLFGKGVTYGWLERQFRDGASVRYIQFRNRYNDEAFKEEYGDNAVPLFCVHSSGDVEIFNEKSPPQPKQGSSIIFAHVHQMKSGMERPEPMEVNMSNTKSQDDS